MPDAMTMSTDAWMRGTALRNQWCTGKLRRAHPERSTLRRGIFSTFVILGAVLAAAPVHAADPAKIDAKAYVFELSPGWGPLSKEGPKNLENYNFYNLQGDVVQLRVSRELKPKAYAAARKDAQAEREDRAQDGWKPVRSRVVKLPPLGEVDESVHVDPERPLTLYSYNVYGPARIASITIMFNRRDLSASESARKIVKGLRWKKTASAAPEKTRKK